jgi:hypothetical protein
MILKDMKLKRSRKTGIQTSGSGPNQFISFTTNPYRFLHPGLCNGFPFSVLCDSYLKIPVAQLDLKSILYYRKKTSNKITYKFANGQTYLDNYLRTPQEERFFPQTISHRITTNRKIDNKRTNAAVCIFENEFRSFNDIDISELDYTIYVSSDIQKEIILSFGFDVYLDDYFVILKAIQNTPRTGNILGYIPWNKKKETYVKRKLKKKKQ